jgi:hypothetical protein
MKPEALTFTPEEKRMALNGWVYSKVSSRRGLRATITKLDGRSRADLVFDYAGYRASLTRSL